MRSPLWSRTSGRRTRARRGRWTRCGGASVRSGAMVTLAGTPAPVVLLLDNVTMAPPVEAGVVKVTVPVLGAPPTTLVGLTVTEDRVGAAGAGLTVSTAVRETAPRAPVIVSAVEAVAIFVVVVKVALVAPAATGALAGTVGTAVLAPLRLTMGPPGGAPAVSGAGPLGE